MAYSGSVSTLAARPISTFVRPYGPCTQVDIGLAARIDTQPRMPSSVGFVYIWYMVLVLWYNGTMVYTSKVIWYSMVWYYEYGYGTN